MTSEVNTKSTEIGSALNLKSVKDALHDVVKQDKKIMYSSEELEIMRQVKNRLQVEDNLAFVNPRFLAYTVITCKNRVEDAIQKYRQYLKAISACGMSTVESDEDMWADPAIGPFLREFYIPCGVDLEGRQILWIRGDKPILEFQEQTAIRAGLLYVMAIHGDNKSLREGITFVIDTSKRGTWKQVGNEAKLRRINQSYPLRPQVIYLAGSSPAMRLVINGLIRIASLFTKQKILQRIKFVSLDQAMDVVPKESGPKYLGGGGGGIEDVVEWTRLRYNDLPVPSL